MHHPEEVSGIYFLSSRRDHFGDWKHQELELGEKCPPAYLFNVLARGTMGRSNHSPSLQIPAGARSNRQ